ncbi:LysR family transcriptional regulator [Bradyrhizobium tropiciagri]|uniref:LysR family transcriptional regulator n=1 Tax=Bradyrhizobium tropiciagri TaxID=312253 RepID=UPI00067D6D7E|nr:LysR family transcriptional regulator [Bradyrhizobium tropiciagri]
MTETGNTNSDGRISSTVAISLQHLRFAVAACDSGSLRRAAEALSVQHSALSRSIAQLEILVGAALFARSSGGVKPTPEGRRFLGNARQILDRLDALIGTGLAHDRSGTGHLCIGISSSIFTDRLRTVILDFKVRFPSVRLAMLEQCRGRIATTPMKGTPDIVIAPGEPFALDSGSFPLWSERVLLSVPQSHPLASRDFVYWTALRHETLLLSDHALGREFERLLITKLACFVDRPRIEWHHVCRDNISYLISMGFGIGFTLESDVKASSGDLAHAEIRDGMGTSRIGFSAFWRPDNDNPMLGNFLQLLTEHYPSPAIGG